VRKKTTYKKSSFFTSQKWAYVGSFLLSVLLVYVAFRFQHRLAHFRSLGLFGIFLINLIGSSTLFIPAPAIATVVAGGVVFPPFLVAIAASIGSALGDMLGYFLGRSGRHIILNHTEHKWLVRFKRLFTRFADILIFLFALVPNPFFDAVGIVSGVSEFPPIRFFLEMLVARFLRNLFLASIGARL